MSWHPDLSERLGWPAIRSLLRPVTLAARKRRDKAWRTPPPAARRDQEVALLRAMEALLAPRPELAARLVRLLEASGDPAQALALLDEGVALQDQDFFAIRQLIRATVGVGRIIADELDSLGHLLDTVDGAALASLSELLDAGRGGARPFAIHAGHAPAIAPLEAKHRELLRRSVLLQQAQREALIEALGVLPDAEGLFWLPESGSGALRDDPRLRPLRSVDGQQAWARVPVPEERQLQDAMEENARALALLRDDARARLAEALAPHAAMLRRSMDMLVDLDLRLALLDLRRTWEGCWPETGDTLLVEGAWLPALRDALKGADSGLQLLDLELVPGNHVLTGPNMGGKSVALRTIATCTALGLLGWPIPARRCVLPPLKGCALIGGERERIEAGLSRFGSELESIAEALRMQGPILLLLDEPAVATAPAEGRALLEALLEYLETRGDVTALLASHLHLRMRPGWRAWRVRGLQGVDVDALSRDLRDHGRGAALQRHMDYALEASEGALRTSDALRIARLFPLPSELLDRAEHLLAVPENSAPDEDNDA